jgi:hypothetical protein
MNKLLASVLLAAATCPAGVFAAQMQTQSTPAPSPSASMAGMKQGTMQGGAMKNMQGGVPLVPTDKKGPGGSATLAQQGPNLIVTLALPTALATNAQAAIVNGSCASQGSSAPANASGTYKLAVGSTAPAQTVLNNMTITTLTSSPHAIVVKTAATTLCGDVANMIPPQRP